MKTWNSGPDSSYTKILFQARGHWALTRIIHLSERWWEGWTLALQRWQAKLRPNTSSLPWRRPFRHVQSNIQHMHRNLEANTSTTASIMKAAAPKPRPINTQSQPHPQHTQQPHTLPASEQSTWVDQSKPDHLLLLLLLPWPLPQTLGAACCFWLPSRQSTVLLLLLTCEVTNRPPPNAWLTNSTRGKCPLPIL